MQATRTGIELHNGLPFEVRIPPKQIPNRTTMTDDEIDASRSEYASSTLVALECTTPNTVHAVWNYQRTEVATRERTRPNLLQPFRENKRRKSPTVGERIIPDACDTTWNR